MKAVVYDRYGSPDALRVADVPVPTPKAEQVLIRVAATSINLSDWETLVGRPMYARIGGLRRPARRTLGSDIAGTVEAVGSSVTEFQVGDEVFGDNLWAKGGFAEYAVAPASVLARKPDGLSFAEASTIPQAGAIALQGTVGVTTGSRLLINGAGGGSGAFAIQVAKEAGAHVTGVDNSSKLDFMRSLGADEVIDYRTQDFASSGERYDNILDMVASRPAVACRRALRPGGRYRCIGGSVPTILRILIGGAALGVLDDRRIGVLGVEEGPAHFGPLAERCAAGTIDVHIHRTFDLDGVAEALALVGDGLSLGKLVIEPD